MKSPYYDIQDSRKLFGSSEGLMTFIKKLLLQKYKVFEMENHNGDLVPYHTHPFPEMILVLDGKMRLIIEEDIVDVSAGELITIKPFAIHLASFPDEQSCRFYLLFSDRKV